MDRTKRFDEKNYEFNKQSKNGVYLIHGFTNTTYETKNLAQYLADSGYRTIANNLPGHGTTIEECNRVKYVDWLESVEQGVATLASECDKIHIIGSSMGGVLGLHIASKFPINSLTAAAPVLQFKNEFKTRILVPLFNNIIPMVSKSSQYKDGENMDFYGYTHYPNKALNQFRKLTNIVRNNLVKVKCPTLLMYSKSDKTCIMKNYNIVNDNIASLIKEKLILDNISHAMFMDNHDINEYDLIYKTIKDFIGKF
tara:strand:- start:429 stop:1190 length:762 start_codon:yes stop_codon:yes gene_type:complete